MAEFDNCTVDICLAAGRLHQNVILIYLSGALLFLAGACIVVKKKLLPVSLLLGTVLLAIFCFYFIPYQFMKPARYTVYGNWENAAKELALAAGALVIAGSHFAWNTNRNIASFKKLIPLGIPLYALTILSFSMDHFVYAKQAAGYVPSWVPNPVFWIYLTGSSLLASSVAILLNIKRRLAATLLGIMIFIWVIILHIPKSIAAPTAYDGAEVSSAFLALAYCGIAFVIARSSGWLSKWKN